MQCYQFPFTFAAVYGLMLLPVPADTNQALGYYHLDRIKTSIEMDRWTLLLTKQDVPRTPPPNTQPKTGLDGSLCRQTEMSLTALIAEDAGWVTLGDRPVVWFYVPYGAEDVERAEFVLNSGDQTRRIYRESFTLPKTPGIVGLQLPSSIALQPGEGYRWYLKLSCQNRNGQEIQETVDAPIDRMVTSSELERQVNNVTSEVWYDNLTLLMQQLEDKPQDRATQTAWINFLNRMNSLQKKPIVDAEKLVSQPIHNVIVLPEPTPDDLP